MRKLFVLFVVFFMVFAFYAIAEDKEVKEADEIIFLDDKEVNKDASVVLEDGKVDLSDYEKPEDWNCFDTDGGRNYYEKGTAGEEEYEKYFTDYCFDEEDLFEHDCGEWGGVEMQDGVSHNGLGGSRYKCPYGCKDGACVKE